MNMTGRRYAVLFLVSALACWILVSHTIPRVVTAMKMTTRSSMVVKNKLPQRNNKVSDRSRPKILLLTYMRSGSTFVGSMFGVNSDIFYVFEPLRALDRNRKAGVLHTLNGTVRPFSYMKETHRTLNYIFKCELEALSVENLQDIFWSLSSKGRSYFQCTGKRPSRQNITTCVPTLSKSCSQRKALTIKTIRYRMRMAERMIQTDQSLKVIHLIRDPRATIYSRLRYGFVRGRTLDRHSQNHCRMVYDDIIIGRRLSATYPDNIKLVLYEDITIDTVEVVKDIYNFIEMPFTDEIAKHIKELGSKDDKNCFLCTGRSNATHQLLKWRTSVNFSDVEIIDKNCGDVYKSLGYLPASSEDILRNLSHPLRIKLT